MSTSAGTGVAETGDGSRATGVAEGRTAGLLGVAAAFAVGAGESVLDSVGSDLDGKMSTIIKTTRNPPPAAISTRWFLTTHADITAADGTCNDGSGGGGVRGDDDATATDDVAAGSDGVAGVTDDAAGATSDAAGATDDAAAAGNDSVVADDATGIGGGFVVVEGCASGISGVARAGGDTTGICGSVATTDCDVAGMGGGFVVAEVDGSGSVARTDGPHTGIGGGVVTDGDVTGADRGGAGAACDASGPFSCAGGSINQDGRTDSSEDSTSDDSGAFSGPAGWSINQDGRTSSEASESEGPVTAADAPGGDPAETTLGTDGTFGADTECNPGIERGSGGAGTTWGTPVMDGDVSRSGRMDRACRRTSSTRAPLIEDVDPPNALSACPSVAASGNRVSGFFSRHRSTTSARPFEIAESRTRGDRGCSTITFTRTCETESPPKGSAPVRSS